VTDVVQYSSSCAIDRANDAVTDDVLTKTTTTTTTSSTRCFSPTNAGIVDYDDNNDDSRCAAEMLEVGQVEGS